MIYLKILGFTFLLFSINTFGSNCNLLGRYEGNVPLDGNWNIGETRFYPNIKCKAKTCLTVQDAVKMAIKRGFKSKKSFITVFESQLNIISKLSNLIPSVEISLGSGQYPISIFETLSNLLGFLIPSNWFDWIESIYLYKAQSYLYVHTLINLAYTTQLIFYAYHLNVVDYFIIKYYHQNLVELEANINGKFEDYELTKEDYLRIQQYIIELEIQMLEIRKTLEEEIGNFAFSINYKGDWHELGLEMFNHPDEQNLKYANIDEWVEGGLKNSNYLVAIKYQILAAKFARFSRMFGFFSIKQDGTMGISLSLSYISDLILSQTTIKRLRVEYEEAEQEIRKDLWQAGHNFNNSIDIQNKYEEAKSVNMELLDIILRKYHFEKSIRRTHLLNAIPSAIKFERGINQMIHLRFISELEYALLSNKMTKPYQIPNQIPKRTPPDRQNHYKKWKEDQDIKSSKGFKKGNVNTLLQIEGINFL